MANTRKLISSVEGKVSVFQIIGFVLISLGVLYCLAKLFWASSFWGYSPIHGDKFAIAFFIIMLGVSFAFPDLLQDQTGGLSTMRIVVFMMINVICILMLKSGWNIAYIKDITINPYLMGVIAFVFGSKATQAYFEGKLAVPGSTSSLSSTTTLYSQADIAKLAVSQYRETLMAKFNNIESISDSVNDLNGAKTHIVTIYLRDNNIDEIPRNLLVTIPGQNPQTINTEIISNVGAAEIHSNTVTDENDLNYKGSLCCLVKSDTDSFFGYVTAGHIYSKGAYDDYNGILADSDSCEVNIDGEASGKWYFQTMSQQQDLAIIKADTSKKLDFISFSKGYYQIKDSDVKNNSEALLVKSKRGDIKPAYILDYNTSFNIKYRFGYVHLLQNIILIGSTHDRNSSKTLSEDGDSGACVYRESGELIGMLVGGNDKYSFVLPIKDTLDSLNFKPI